MTKIIFFKSIKGHTFSEPQARSNLNDDDNDDDNNDNDALWAVLGGQWGLGIFLSEWPPNGPV